MNNEARKKLLQYRLGITGGLLAVSVYSIVELLGTNGLDAILGMSINFLAVAIPLLSLDVYLTAYELLTEKVVRSLLLSLMRFVSIISIIIGIGLFFWHFSEDTGLLFMLSFVFSAVVWVFLRK